MPGMEERTKPEDSQSFAVALGAVFRRLREEKGIAQVDLAVAVSRQRTYISELELGKRNPTLDTMRLIAHCLGTPLSEVLREAERAANQP